MNTELLSPGLMLAAPLLSLGLKRSVHDDNAVPDDNQTLDFANSTLSSNQQQGCQ